MYRVTYSFYGKYEKEKSFEDYEEAKRFFYGYAVRNKAITKAELITP